MTWHAYPNELVCTDIDHVLPFAATTPPAEGAEPGELARFHTLVEERFTAGAGTFRITTDSGAFVARPS